MLTGRTPADSQPSGWVFICLLVGLRGFCVAWGWAAVWFIACAGAVEYNWLKVLIRFPSLFSSVADWCSKLPRRAAQPATVHLHQHWTQTQPPPHLPANHTHTNTRQTHTQTKGTPKTRKIYTYSWFCIIIFMFVTLIVFTKRSKSKLSYSVGWGGQIVPTSLYILTYIKSLVILFICVNESHTHTHTITHTYTQQTSLDVCQYTRFRCTFKRTWRQSFLDDLPAPHFTHTHEHTHFRLLISH